MSILDNFTATQNSDNRFHWLPIKNIKTVVIGSTCTHAFLLPFKYSEQISNSKILYLQGVNTILEKYPADYSLQEKENSTVLTIKLNKAETNKFDNTVLQTCVQIKFETNTNTTFYSPMEPIKIIKTIPDLNTPNFS